MIGQIITLTLLQEKGLIQKCTDGLADYFIESEKFHLDIGIEVNNEEITLGTLSDTSFYYLPHIKYMHQLEALYYILNNTLLKANYDG